MIRPGFAEPLLRRREGSLYRQGKGSKLLRDANIKGTRGASFHGKLTKGSRLLKEAKAKWPRLPKEAERRIKLLEEAKTKVCARGHGLCILAGTAGMHHAWKVQKGQTG